MSEDIRGRFLNKAGLTDNASLWEVVEGIRAIPYGRPTVPTAEGAVNEWRGTCSTKHALLAEVLSDRRHLDVKLVHRVYRLYPDQARDLFGEEVAEIVPEEGLVDVHTYATLQVEDRRVRVDVTFPSSDVWDGRSDMALACGDGKDYPADGADPWALKDQLVATHTDPKVREPFIQALTDRA